MPMDYTILSECSGCQESISCFKKIAGILSDDEIRRLKIVKEDVEKSHNPTVYDLRLGDFHYLYSGGKDSDGDEKWKAIYIGTDTLNHINRGFDEPDHFVRLNNMDQNTLVIPPFGAALIELYETIDTDSVANQGILVTGRFDLKLSLVNKGLFSQQGTQIEPCYKGKMYCFIHNLSGEEIKLKQREPIASIEFSYVSCFCNQEKRKEIIQRLRDHNRSIQRYSDSNTCNVGQGIKNIRFFKQNRTLPNICGLYSYSGQVSSLVEEKVVSDSVIKKIKKEINFRMELIKVIIPAVMTLLVAIVAGYFGLVKPFLETNYTTKIANIQSQIDELKEKDKDFEQTTLLVSGTQADIAALQTQIDSMEIALEEVENELKDSFSVDDVQSNDDRDNGIGIDEGSTTD